MQPRADTEDDMLTHLLRGFMRSLRRYLAAGGSEDNIEKFVNRASVVAVGALMIWPAGGFAGGLVGFLKAVGKQFWKARRWIL